MFSSLFIAIFDAIKQGRTEDFVRGGGEIFFHELKVVTSNEKKKTLGKKLKRQLQ